MPAELTRIPGPTESRLDALEAKADALDAHLRLSARQAAQLIEHHKQELCETIDWLQAKVEAIADLPQATRREIARAAGELKAQIGRGRIDARQVVESQRQRIAAALAEFDGELVSALAGARRQLDAISLRALRRCQRAREALDVEMCVAEFRARLESELHGASLEQRKQELATEIAQLKQQIDERRDHLAGQREQSAKQWRIADTELLASVEQVAGLLERLLS